MQADVRCRPLSLPTAAKKAVHLLRRLLTRLQVTGAFTVASKSNRSLGEHGIRTKNHNVADRSAIARRRLRDQPGAHSTGDQRFRDYSAKSAAWTLCLPDSRAWQISLVDERQTARVQLRIAD